MLQLNLIGNLGADAEKKNLNGNDYISFRVAHTEKSGDKERTQWVSVLMSSRSDALLQYLKKGAKVFVCGRCSVRAFSSPTTKQWEAGIDLFAERLELVGMRQEVSVDSIHKAIGDGKLFVNDLRNIIAEYDSDKPFDEPRQPLDFA